MNDGPSPPYRSVVRGVLLLFAAAGLAGGIAYVAFVPPTADSWYPRCQLHSLTALHCPGCGTTRSLHAALNGHFVQSLAYNAIAWVVLPVLGFALARSLWHWARDTPVPESRTHRFTPWILGAMLLLFGILRNLPWEPFTLLAPHELAK